jgi:hypothetical protein
MSLAILEGMLGYSSHTANKGRGFRMVWTTLPPWSILERSSGRIIYFIICLIINFSILPNTRLAVIAANFHAMVTSPVLYARNSVKLAAIISNAISYAISLAYPVLKIAPGHVYIDYCIWLEQNNDLDLVVSGRKNV